MDGRIEVGDQIVQVNRSSFENLSDVEAVDLLRKAAASRKLAVLAFIFPHLLSTSFIEYQCSKCVILLVLYLAILFQANHTLCCQKDVQ